MLRRLETTVLALVVALLIVGLSVSVASQPWLTRQLAQSHSNGAPLGLSEERVLELAEEVRAYVVDGEGTLPAVVDGAEGFDPAAVSHLDDVREVLALARIITIVCAALVVLWAIASVRRKTVDRLASGLRMGAAFPVLLIVLSVLTALIDFSAFFAWFHSLFFAQGTWTFSAESLLILLFPQGFWEGAGLWVGGFVVAFSALAWLVAGWVRRAAQRADA